MYLVGFCLLGSWKPKIILSHCWVVTDSNLKGAVANRIPILPPMKTNELFRESARALEFRLDTKSQNLGQSENSRQVKNIII